MALSAVALSLGGPIEEGGGDGLGRDCVGFSMFSSVSLSLSLLYSGTRFEREFLDRDVAVLSLGCERLWFGVRSVEVAAGFPASLSTISVTLLFPLSVISVWVPQLTVLVFFGLGEEGVALGNEWFRSWAAWSPPSSITYLVSISAAKDLAGEFVLG